MEADDLLCSSNARSRTPLVGRAQWKINQPPSLKREQASLEGAIDGNVSLDACNTERPLHPQEHRQPEGSRIIGFHGVISARMMACG
jgi:hypothetical protein